jgi:hypothetical protein
MKDDELKYWSVSNPLFEFGKREHRGGLEESLKTSVEITEQEFKELLNNPDNDYKYYCFDNRCNQILFCGKYELDYMWLFIQLTND